MTRDEIRKIVREEVAHALSEHAKRGSKVLTPHGPGVVLSLAGEQARVKLTSGAVVRLHRDRVKGNG